MLLTMKETLAEGKVPPALLKKLLKHTARGSNSQGNDAGVIVGAAAGEDAAVVRGAPSLVITADPITFTEIYIGTYAVAVNSNDIVAMGGRPHYLTTTILLPLGTQRSRLEQVFKEIQEAAAASGILWVGGHTEVSPAVNRIVVSAQAVGFLKKNPTTTANARPGELLVMSKWAGLEGSTLIARERPEEARKLLGPKKFREVLSWIKKISVAAEGRILEPVAVGAAHDPTEGGIATSIHEIASRSRVGVRVFLEKITIRTPTKQLCTFFDLDPLGLLSSGTLLFTCSPGEADKACRTLIETGVGAAIIGEITNNPDQVDLIDHGRSRPLPFFVRDELIKLQ